MAIPILEIAPGAFKGLDQSVDQNLLNLAYSPDCKNLTVKDGALHVRGGFTKNVSTVAPAPTAPETGGTIRYIAWFGALASTGDDSYAIATGQNGIPIIGMRFTSESYNYRWYAYYKLTSNAAAATWNLITTDGTTAGMTSMIPVYASHVAYKKDSTNILIFTGNGKPQKVFFERTGVSYPYSYAVKSADLGGAPQESQRDITLHRERIWLGVRQGTNTVYYSNALDPEDWTTAGETGSLTIDTFDGDFVVGVRNWLDDVLIFKSNTIWRVMGDIPSEYYLEQIFSSNGVIHEKSICTDGTNCFFASTDGIYQYNGVEVKPLLTKEIATLYPTMDGLKGYVFDNKLYMIESAWNEKTLVYDLRNKTVELYDMNAGLAFYDATVYDRKLIVTDGYYLYEYSATALLDNATAIAAYWFTPETDFGYPNAEKTLIDLYFTAYGTTSAGAAGGQIKVTVYFTKRATQKTKEKTITMETTRRVHKLRFNVTGRLFKVKIENVSGSAMTVSNLKMVFELNKD